MAAPRNEQKHGLDARSPHATGVGSCSPFRTTPDESPQAAHSAVVGAGGPSKTLQAGDFEPEMQDESFLAVREIDPG